MDELSVCLHKLPIGCCSGDIVVNHLMYADDIVLLAPSAKGMQTIIETTYAYGNTYDIVFNITKSQVMFYDTLKMGQPVNISLGSVRNKEKISLVRRTSNFENLLVRQSQHLSKQFPRNEAHGLALAWVRNKNADNLL